MRTMKYFIILAFALFVSTSTYAQKKHFEGEITYSVSITLDKTARKFIKDADGEYNIKTVYKNGNEKSQENFYGSISYIFRDKDMCYGYSPLTKKGYKCKYSEAMQYYDKVRQTVDNTVKPTGETKEAFGITFEHFKGQQSTTTDLLGAKLTGTEDHDYWVCRDYDENYIMSIKIPGLYESFDWLAKMRMPLMGSFDQHLEISIEELSQREVKDEEFDLPEDVTFEEVANIALMEKKLKSDYKKYTKTQGKKKGEDVKREGAAKVKGEWDF
jgi:hypothetical protein